MSAQFSTESKRAIRSVWAKLLLSFLHDTLNKKLVYLGLPGENAYDIHEWIEYLDIVYAFECGNYKSQLSVEEARKKLIALEEIGLTLQRKKQLSDFQLYDGYIEEVIIRGFDNSASQKDFIQGDVITLYNLDFCNQVTSPIEYRDKEGNLEKAFKFDAIGKLLKLQQSMKPSSKKFIMFLTLHCSFKGKEFHNFQNFPPDGQFKKYLQVVERLSKGKKAPYWIKAFVYYHLSGYFKMHQFTADFLPVIHYIGDNSEPLLCFTIIGTQGATHAESSNQQINNFLNGKFISVDSNGGFINNASLVAHDEVDWEDVNPLQLFKSSKMYKENWKDTK
ncbi:hypothetical protein J2I47_13875 [Fibrella sp. HMF5335]|uniref:Uncharacterized protein n=1 Tax=Fibrella rubiginis TaxID=2817060 RepID=A0A939GJ05_9BACT|nr:hypothetical protein [Fibrella rubiginis]MBO0937641.1 hypothetical protein [Fibrella rubiginis]